MKIIISVFGTNKQDQQDALDAAQKTIDKAQADVDKYKKKVSECEDYIYYLKNNHRIQTYCLN